MSTYCEHGFALKQSCPLCCRGKGACGGGEFVTAPHPEFNQVMARLDAILNCLERLPKDKIDEIVKNLDKIAKTLQDIESPLA